MKLKYYLRGIGIGVIITTIIFMISISLHKNEMRQESVPQQETGAQTVAEAQSEKDLYEPTEQTDKTKQKDSEEQTAKTDTEEKSTEKKNTENKNTEVKNTEETDIEKKNTEEKNAQEKASDKKSDAKTEKSEAADRKAEEEKQDNKKSDKTKVRIQIKGGDYSDVTCRRLQEAGLIDDAEAFNKYLIQKDYDDLILPGVYDIPKDATYEEIAILLITKVEKETAQ